MKTLHFGWEVDNIDNNSAQLAAPIVKPVTIRAAQFDCSYMVLGRPYGVSLFGIKFGNPPNFAEVLVSLGIFPQVTAADEFGTAVFSGAPTVHGETGAGHIACVILKTWVGRSAIASATARNVYVSGLNISAGPGQVLQANLSHVGFVGNIEMQGVLFYD